MPGFQRPRQEMARGTEHFRSNSQNHGFVVSEEYTVASDGGTANLHLKNPSENEITVLFDDIIVGTQLLSTVRLHDEFSSAPSNGTSVEIQNMMLDSAHSLTTGGNMEANRNVSFTADSTRVTTLVGGGQVKESIGTVGRPPLFAMEPGREIVIETTNNDVEDSETALTITYSEIHRVYSNS